MAADKEKVLDTAQKYADKNQYDKAIKEIQKILDSYSTDPRVLLRLATYYERGQHIAEAVQTLRKGTHESQASRTSSDEKCFP